MTSQFGSGGVEPQLQIPAGAGTGAGASNASLHLPTLLPPPHPNCNARPGLCGPQDLPPWACVGLQEIGVIVGHR